MQMFNNRRFVKIYEHGFGPGTKGKYSIMMQLANGGNLGTYTKPSRYGGQRASMVEVLRFTTEILEGLAIMHSQNVVHRDVKPDNIFMHCERDATGNKICHAKVADLGLACVKGGGRGSVIQECSDLGGTPIYLSPEIAAVITGRGNVKAAIQPSNDVFAVGLMMYELIFQQRSPAIVMNQGDRGLFESIARISESWVPSSFPGGIGWSTFPEQAATYKLLTNMLKRSMTARIDSATAAMEARRLLEAAALHTGSADSDLGEDSLDRCFEEEDIISPGSAHPVAPAPDRRPVRPDRRPVRPKPQPKPKPEPAAADESEGEGEDEGPGDATIEGDEYALIKGVKYSSELRFIFKGVGQQLGRLGLGEEGLDYADGRTAGSNGKRKYGPKAFWHGKWQFVEIAEMPVEQAYDEMAALLDGAFGRDIVVRARRIG